MGVCLYSMWLYGMIRTVYGRAVKASSWKNIGWAAYLGKAFPCSSYLSLSINGITS